MIKTGYFSNWKNVFQISLGLVVVLFLSWLVFHTSQYVPAEHKDSWLIVFISYGVLASMIFGVSDIRAKLFDIKFVDFLIRGSVPFVISLFAFFYLFTYFEPADYTLFDVLSNVPTWLLILHAFVFATLESAIWQGYLDQKVGHPWSELVAGVFHWGIWSGGAVIVIFSASLLFALFSYVNYRFSINKNDIVPAIAVHTAFNFIKLGLIFSF